MDREKFKHMKEMSKYNDITSDLNKLCNKIIENHCLNLYIK